MRLALLLASLAAAAPVFAYSPDYFPLQVGNQWVYRVTQAGRASLQAVAVTGTQERGGETFAVVEGLGPVTLLLRQEETGVLRGLHPDGRSFVWADFATAAGGEFAPTVDECSARATVASRDAVVKTPAGEFGNALQVTYTGPCADAGLTSEHYLPWIGMVRRESTSFAGPVVMELVYSRTGGVTTLGQPETAFGLSLGGQRVPLGTRELEARLSLRATAEPVELHFSSSQRFDFQIRNARGEVVYTWSATRLFAAVLGTEIVQGERNWADTLPVESLPEGRYTVEGWLTTSGERRFAASASFDVTGR